MPLFWMVATLIVAAFGSLLFSTLTYALRDLPRIRLAEFLERNGRQRWIDATADYIEDLVLVTAFWRMLFNTAIVVFSLTIVERGIGHRGSAYGLAALLAGIVTLLFSVAIPNSVAQYAAAEIVGSFAEVLWFLRVLMTPVTAVMHGIDELVRNAAGAPKPPNPNRSSRKSCPSSRRGKRKASLMSKNAK